MADAPQVLIVGGGKMGEAILAGWLASDAPQVADLQPKDFLVVNPTAERRADLAARYGVATVADVTDLADLPGQPGLDAKIQDFHPDLVVLAVKPQILMDVLDSMADLDTFQGGASGPLFISIAAGMRSDSIAKALPPGSRVVRVMPNMPLQIAAGASGVCGGPGTDAADIQAVADLFGVLGIAEVVDEDQMDAVCALSGSGPAYVAAMVESLTAAAMEEGLPESLASSLALQTVLGTARYIQESGKSAAEVRESICSPGGTTLAALDAMTAEGFDEVFKAGVRAAAMRSKELAECI